MSQLMFNRHELKFLIDVKLHSAISKQMIPFMARDAYCKDNMHYSITSLYYDTYDYVCYRDKIDGQKIRQKLRIRKYRDGGPVYVELKNKYINQVMKRRLALNPGDLEGFLSGSVGLSEVCRTDKELAIARELRLFMHSHKLEPKVNIHYQREAYQGKYDPGLRVTFDREIACCSVRGSEFSFDRKKYVMNPYYMVLEIKFNRAMPLWLGHILNSHNLSETRFSKYCMAVDASGFRPFLTGQA